DEEKVDAPTVAPSEAPTSTVGPELRKAVFELEQTLSQALADGMVLESMGEASAVAGALGRVLRLATAAGDTVTFSKAKATLAHVSGLGPAHVDAAGQKIFKALEAEWSKASPK